MGDTLPSARNPIVYDDDEPITLRTCEACAGEGCMWCKDGYQDATQNMKWAKFRARMKYVSNTYALVESMLLDIIERLKANGSDEALSLAIHGQNLLDTWDRTDPVNGGRDQIIEAMKAHNRLALDYLIQDK